MSEVAIIEPEHKPRSVVVDMAERFGMEPGPFEATLRATVCKTASREEFAAFLLVAKEYNLNPLTKEIFAFPAKGGGIVPVVSIDGWCRIINEHKACDGIEFMDTREDGKLVSITARIYRKDRSHPTEVTEYMAECAGSTDVWKRWPNRMLRHKSLIQAARYAFGFSGIYDEDEFDRMESARDVTPVQSGVMARLKGTQEGAGFDADHVDRETTKPRRTRKPKDEPAPADTTTEADSDPVVVVHGKNYIDKDTGEVLGERPTSTEGATKTASAPSAEPEQASSDSVTDAPTASAEETSSPTSPGEQSETGLPEADAISEGYPKPDEVYHLTGDAWEFDAKRGHERRDTYKNGEPFSDAGRDKGYSIYEDHPPEGPGTQASAEVTNAASEIPSEPDDEFPPEFQTYIDAIEGAKTWDAAKEAMKEYFKTDTFKNKPITAQNIDRRATYETLTENKVPLPDHAMDVSLFRLWIEAQEDAEAIQGTLHVLESKSPSFQQAGPAVQNGIQTAVAARVSAIKG